MTDIPIIKRGATGSISGFDLITKFSDPTLSETNFSVDELLAYLTQLNALYGPDRLRTLMMTIQNHVRNFDNPHKDTLDMLSGDNLGTLMQAFIPGTVPLQHPVDAFDAEFDLSSPLIPLSIQRDSSYYVIDRQGFLALVAANDLGTDWSNGYPVIPCWPTTNQLVNNIDMEANGNFAFVNTSTVADTTSSVVPNMHSTQIAIQENDAQGQFGFDYTQTGLSMGGEYTFSALFFCQQIVGTFVLRTPSGNAYIDIASMNTFCDSTIRLHLQVLPNNWWRVGVQFVIQDTSATINWRFYPESLDSLADANASQLQYKGTQGKTLFSVCFPQFVDQPGLPPLTDSNQIAQSTITMPGYSNAVSSATGMVVVRNKVYPRISSTATAPILACGSGFSVGVAGNNYTVAVGPSTLATSITNDGGTSSIAVSYSPSSITYKTTGASKVSMNVTVNPIAAFDTYTFGPFPGGINAFEIYGIADDKDAVSFLTGD